MTRFLCEICPILTKKSSLIIFSQLRTTKKQVRFILPLARPKEIFRMMSRGDSRTIGNNDGTLIIKILQKKLYLLPK